MSARYFQTELGEKYSILGFMQNPTKRPLPKTSMWYVHNGFTHRADVERYRISLRSGIKKAHKISTNYLMHKLTCDVRYVQGRVLP